VDFGAFEFGVVLLVAEGADFVCEDEIAFVFIVDREEVLLVQFALPDDVQQFFFWEAHRQGIGGGHDVELNIAASVEEGVRQEDGRVLCFSL
jgi:hypothetical protein